MEYSSDICGILIAREGISLYLCVCLNDLKRYTALCREVNVCAGRGGGGCVGFGFRSMKRTLEQCGD